jgi:hypothetical protein
MSSQRNLFDVVDIVRVTRYSHLVPVYSTAKRGCVCNIKNIDNNLRLNHNIYNDWRWYVSMVKSSQIQPYYISTFKSFNN